MRIPSGRCHPDFVQRLFDFGLDRLGVLVGYICGLINPATSLMGHAVWKNSNGVTANVNYCIAMMINGNYAGAIQHCKVAVTVEPDIDLAVEHALLRQGEPDESRYITICNEGYFRKTQATTKELSCGRDQEKDPRDNPDARL